ncbi:mariner Mos1 transposase [Trichonephila clavipes]|nr:mariner Mos1 transposase [Trichonephila clavipes]
MNRCPDLVVCLKRDLQCLRPEASLVLIYRPNVAGMKGRVDLAQPVNRTPGLWCGSTIHYHSILFGKITTGAYYASLLDKLRAELKEKWPHLQKKKILFHQDNPPSHISAVAMVKIHELRFELFDHQPYLPDLAPSDFFLFSSKYCAQRTDFYQMKMQSS